MKDNFDLIMSLTASVTLGLIILTVIMQAINFVRIMRIEREIKEKLDEHLCLRK